MHPRPLTLAAALMIALSSPPGALGQDLRFLQDAPVRSFTDSDWEMLRATVDRALKEDEAGVLSWKNQESGNSGSVRTVSRDEREGRACRELEITNQTARASGKALMEFCRVGDEWKAVESPR